MKCKSKVEPENLDGDEKEEQEQNEYDDDVYDAANLAMATK